MNTKGIKFLAVLAVLAMAFAAFAVVNVADTDDAADTSISIGEDTNVLAQSTMKGVYNSTTKTISFSGYAINNTALETTGLTDNTVTVFGAEFKGYAYVAIPLKNTANQKVHIEISNGAYKEAGVIVAPESSPSFDNLGQKITSDGKETRFVQVTNANDYLDVLIPQNGGNVTVKVTNESEVTMVDLTLDFSKSSTKIVLSEDLQGQAATGGTTKWKYVHSTTTLTLNGVNSNIAFYTTDALVVVLTGGTTNTLKAVAPYADGADYKAVIHAQGALTIKAETSLATLNVTNLDETGIGINGGATVTIGDSAHTTNQYTKLNVTGGSQGIYSTGALTIQSADVTATAYEKAIRGASTFGTTNSTIVAKISTSGATNSAGEDDIWGIKVNGNLTNTSSSITTQGLRAKASVTATATYQIYVTGDYTTNDLAGLYLDAENTAKVQLVSDAPAAPAAGIIYVKSDAKVYAPCTEIQNDAGTTIGVATDTFTGVNSVKSKLNGENIKEVGVTVGADTTIASADVPTIKEGQTLAVKTTGAYTLSGNINIGTGDDKIVLGLDGVKGQFTILKGSAKITGTITAGNIAVAGDADVSALTVDGTATLTVSGDSSKVILDGLYIESGKLTITGADIEANSSVKIKNGAALVIGTSSTKVNASGLKISGAGSANTIIYGDASSSYTFPEGETITGTFYIGTAKYELTAAIAGTGDLSISSSGLSGNIAGGKVAMTTGKISGLTVSANSNLVGSYTVSGRITIATDATLDLAIDATATVTIGSAGIITVNGTLKATTATAIVNNGSIIVNGTLTDANMTITGEGTIDYGTSENVNISGVVSADATYVAKQIVTFNGDTKIKSGADLEINGQVIINGDVTLTIEQNASITVTGSAARLTNDGKIVLEAYSDTVGGSALTIEGNAVAINNGEIVVFGEEVHTSTLATGGKLTNNGTITINSDATLTGAITNSKDATLTLKGTYAEAAVVNYGAIVIDGKVSGNINVYDKDATVSLVKKIGTADGDADKLTITAKADIAGSTNKSKVTDAREAQISVDPKSGYVVSGLATTFGSEAVNTAKTEYRTLITISGSVTVSKADGESMPETIAVYNVLGIAKSKVIVSDVLTVDSYTNINLAAGTNLVVSGALVSKLASSNAEVKSIDGTGTLSVTGLVTLAKDVDAAVVKEGAFFSVKDEETSKYTYFYTTLAAAIASGSKTIAVFGEQTISEDITIPAEVAVTTNNAVTIKSGATVTVTNGAKLSKAADITVNGKLIVENKKNLAGVGIIKSAVKTTLGDSEIYSGLAAALSEAEIGSTVVLLDDVEVTEDLTIPDDKALDVGDATLSVKGATLTVDGMLYLRNTNLSVTDKDADNKGALKVTGIMVSDKAFTEKGTAKNAPAGAYYQVVYESAPYYCMSTLDVAMVASIIDIVEGNIELYGENTLGNVLVLKNIDVYSTKFVAGTVTVSDKTAVTFKNAVNDVTAVFMNTEGSVILKDADVKANTAFKSSDKSVFTVAGEIATGDIDNPVLFMGASNLEAKIDFAMVAGDVIVSASKEVTNLYIAGTVTVNNTKTLTITELTLLGSLIAKEKSDTDGAAGKIVIKGDSYIGAEEEDILGADAVLAGKVELDGANIILYVMAGSTVPDELFDETGGLKYTVIMVDGNEYITLMTNGNNVNVPADLIIPVVNGKMDEDDPWIVDGEEADTFVIGATPLVGVNADFKIYRVIVVGDEGIASVYIDDILMVVNNNTFTANNLTAGTHTIKYQIKSGYEGTPVLKLIEGDDGTVLGMNVTLSGTEGLEAGVSTVNLQLSGTSPAVTPTPEPTPTPEEKSEWTITTILLVILVILIAILVVVLILRLNRS